MTELESLKIFVAHSSSLGDVKCELKEEQEKQYIYLTLPVPPSTNERQTISRYPIYTSNGKRHVIINTMATREYYALATLLIPLLNEIHHIPIDTYTPFWFAYYIENMAYDTHNGFKIVCDMLQKAKVVTNDKYILPQTEIPVHDKINPCLIIKFPFNKSPSDGK